MSSEHWVEVRPLESFGEPGDQLALFFSFGMELYYQVDGYDFYLLSPCCRRQLRQPPLGSWGLSPFKLCGNCGEETPYSSDFSILATMAVGTHSSLSESELDEELRNTLVRWTAVWLDDYEAILLSHDLVALCTMLIDLDWDHEDKPPELRGFLAEAVSTFSGAMLNGRPEAVENPAAI